MYKIRATPKVVVLRIWKKDEQTFFIGDVWFQIYAFFDVGLDHPPTKHKSWKERKKKLNSQDARSHMLRIKHTHTCT